MEKSPGEGSFFLKMLLGAGYWLLVAGCWLLVAGGWLQVAGYKNHFYILFIRKINII